MIASGALGHIFNINEIADSANSVSWFHVMLAHAHIVLILSWSPHIFYVVINA
jgi:hypothetical protein